MGINDWTTYGLNLDNGTRVVLEILGRVKTCFRAQNFRIYNKKYLGMIH